MTWRVAWQGAVNGADDDEAVEVLTSVLLGGGALDDEPKDR